MAEILIRGVEMPQDCGDCYLCHDRFCYGLKKLRSNKDYRERPDDCTLVELPEHGDLIDRSKLSFVCGGTTPMEIDYVRRYFVDRMPVIIPSNKEETK